MFKIEFLLFHNKNSLMDSEINYRQLSNLLKDQNIRDWNTQNFIDWYKIKSSQPEVIRTVKEIIIRYIIIPDLFIQKDSLEFLLWKYRALNISSNDVIFTAIHDLYETQHNLTLKATDFISVMDKHFSDLKNQLTNSILELTSSDKTE